MTPMDDRTPAERLHDTALVALALRRAVQETLRDHKRTGHPVAVWRDNQVVWVQPEDFPPLDLLEDQQDPGPHRAQA